MYRHRLDVVRSSRLRSLGGGIALTGVVAGAVLGALAAPTLAQQLRGTEHDVEVLAPRYPNLARSARSPCGACHLHRPTRMPDYGDDFADGVPVVTDPDYVTTNDLGLVVGPRNAPVSTTARKCLSCHDGVIRTPTGNDTMPAPNPGMGGPNLNWWSGGAHNIWGMGQQSAYHPVEIHYPPLPEEKMWEGFQSWPIAGDHNIQFDVGDNPFIVDDPNGPSVWLPLEKDPEHPDRGLVTCLTCHNPHDNSTDELGGFKRGNWPDLCMMCHRVP